MKTRIKLTKQQKKIRQEENRTKRRKDKQELWKTLINTRCMLT